MTATAWIAFARKHWLPLLFALFVLVALIWAARALYSRGVADTENKQQRATVGQVEERNDTNEAVRGMSEGRKCRLIGGMYRNGHCE